MAAAVICETASNPATPIVTHISGVIRPPFDTAPGGGNASVSWCGIIWAIWRLLTDGALKCSKNAQLSHVVASFTLAYSYLQEFENRMAKLPMPDLPPGNLRFLIAELRDLHARAGWPSTRDIARDQQFSHATVHELFTRRWADVPKLPVLIDVVERLALLIRRADADSIVEKFNRLWRAAADHPVSPSWSCVPHLPPEATVRLSGNQSGVAIQSIAFSQVNASADGSTMQWAPGRRRSAAPLTGYPQRARTGAYHLHSSDK